MFAKILDPVCDGPKQLGVLLGKIHAVPFDQCWAGYFLKVTLLLGKKSNLVTVTSY